MSGLVVHPYPIFRFAAVVPDLQPIENLLPPTFWERHGAALLGGGLLVLLLLLVGVAIGWRRRGRPAVVIPPADAARRLLQQLEGGPDNGFLAGRVLQTLRQYLVAALPVLPPGERTVEEIIPHLEMDSRLTAEVKAEIVALLRQCERRQFFTGRSEAPAGFAARALAVVGKIEALRGLPAAGALRNS
jgi:hypothetical protein